MTYSDACDYMENLNKRGIHPGLKGIGLLLDACNNPEKDLKVIHVVGTNGKGSTSMFLAEILRAAGYKVGLFSSPSVFSEREIIKINNREISKDSYAALTEQLQAANTMECTRFEIETAMAFLYFKEKKCDVVVFEAGMGGLNDATNIAPNSLAGVFCPIGLDHTDYLGDTIEKIAENKAGVIKNGAITVSAPQEPSVEAIIRNRAEEKETPVIFSSLNEIRNVKFKLSGTTFDYKEYKKISLNLLGTYQPLNAVTALETALMLREKGYKITENNIRKGLETARISGRFEKISDKPLIYIDGAHNPHASLKLRESIETYFTKKKIVYIMGMLKDKDCECVVKNTVDKASAVFTVATPNKARTLSSFELAEIVRKYNPMVSSMDSVEEALEMAGLMADKDTVIIVFGSLSHLAKVKGAVQKKFFKQNDSHGVKR